MFAAMLAHFPVQKKWSIVIRTQANIKHNKQTTKWVKEEKLLINNDFHMMINMYTKYRKLF